MSLRRRPWEKVRDEERNRAGVGEAMGDDSAPEIILTRGDV